MSTDIQTFVFFDLETTGLPWQEKNQTKIIELCFLAVQRNDIVTSQAGSTPIFRKLSFLVNPKRNISSTVTTITGISNKSVSKAPTFKQRFDSIQKFFDNLTGPICLIAHNGNSFDYKILLAECIDADVTLPYSLLCIDSLIAFRRILKGTTKSYKNIQSIQRETDTGHSDEWPDLDVSTEDWEEIDELCMHVDQLSFNNEFKNINKKINKTEIIQDRDEIVNRVLTPTLKDDMVCTGYTLSALYKRLLNKDAVNAHRAEADCKMLLECFLVLKGDLLPWVDSNNKFLCSIKPLTRYK